MKGLHIALTAGLPICLAGFFAGIIAMLVGIPALIGIVAATNVFTIPEADPATAKLCETR